MTFDFNAVDVSEESALAQAQAVIQRAINESKTKRATMAARMEVPRSFVSRMMTGDHNMTVKTLARALHACGYRVRFEIEKAEVQP